MNFFFLEMLGFLKTFLVHSNFFFFLSHLLPFFCCISLTLDMPHYWVDTNLNTFLATLSEQDCKLKKNNQGGFIVGI